MLLRVNDLSKIFNIHIYGNKLIKGFKKVSFSVEKGEFLGISGPSGSGKSSLLKCIYRTYLPTSGDIWFDSDFLGKINISNLSDILMIDLRHREIGYVSQFLKVIPRVSALDIVAEPLLVKNGLSEKKAKMRAAELLERLNIPRNLFDLSPVTFSGGEQQKINIARNVIWKPKLLLLDEPTASLDKNSVSIVMELLRELKEENVTMVGIFHDEKLMSSIADKIYRMVKGQENEN